MTDENTWMMNLNSPIYSTLLQNKFLILVVVSVHLTEILVALATKQDLVAVVDMGNLAESMRCDLKIC